MLLEFSVTNFRSFKEKQTLSMIPATNKKSEQQESVAVIDDKLSVLKSAVIYGANASGKSNLLLALNTLQNIVLTSAKNNPTDRLIDSESHFLFSANTEKQPIEFELHFSLKGIRYHYLLSILKGVIYQEFLNYYPNNRKTKLFKRIKEDNTYQYTYGEHLKGQKQVVENLTTPNQLYLSKGANNNIEVLAEILIFLNAIFMDLPSNYTSYRRFKRNLLSKLHYKQFANNMKLMICTFGTGVVDFNMKKERNDFGTNIRVETEHNFYDNGEYSGKRSIQLEQESEGTQRLFYFSAIIIDALMNGKTLIFDEFERSLHPHISSYIIQMFNNPKINKNNAQLIVATHDTNLIDKENGLRRDQVWLVEKDKTGASELFSLSDIEGVRQDTPFEKWYLSGRFGAVPNINSLDIELNFKHEAPQVQEA